MGKLILLRHGQSYGNADNFFTGWIDVSLTSQGIEESFAAGKQIASIDIDIIFSSSLIRAQITALLALSIHPSQKVPTVLHPHEGKLEKWGKIYSEETKKRILPMIIAWELNERMYGKLQGLNKQEIREKFGEEQVHIWRRSFDTSPPGGESLKMTLERALPYFKTHILPYLKKGKTVLISAHGNSLRAIVMFLENLSQEEIINIEIPTGVPLLYKYEEGVFLKDVL